MYFVPRRLVSSLTATAMVVTPLSNVITAAYAAPAPAAAELCHGQDEAGFRLEVQKITENAIANGLANVSYLELVGDGWRKNAMDDVIGRQVDIAVNEVIEESSWKDLVQSLAYKEKAKELASTVAGRVYRSESVVKSLDTLSQGVGRAIGKRIELATLDAAAPTMSCVRAFLGNRYGSTVARIVSADTGKQFEINPTAREAQIGAGDVLISGSGAIAGTVILMVRRTVSRMARRIGQRVVGAVLGRLVTVVAGGVGLVLIAKDIWDLRNGVLPIIAAEMKSDESHQKIREELAAVLKTQLTEQTKTLSAQTADKVVGIWQEFRRVHAKVIELTEKHDRFKGFLDTVGREDMPKLDRVAAIVLANEGEDGILKRLGDGTLDEAVKNFDNNALQIAEDANSIEESFGWINLTGAKLGPIVEYELHRRARPDELTKAGLNKILALEDRLAIVRLAELSREARQPLIELETGRLKSLVKSLNAVELDSLSRFMTGLKPAAKTRVLNAVESDPGKFRKISDPVIREAILRSDDQQSAVGLMLRSGGLGDVSQIPEDVGLVLDGRIDPRLVWEKHTVPLIVIAVLGLMFFALIWRLIFGRRPKVVIKASDIPQNPTGGRHA